jgi:glycosyltransferase involved in cell wall biosynthesis
VRVALIAEQVLAPVPGGIGRYTAELAAALTRTSPADRVTAWTAWHRGAAMPPGLDGPRRLPLPRRALIAAWERGVGPVPRDADLVHAPSLLMPPRRLPLVVTIHDAVPWTHPETLTPRGVRWHVAMATRAARHASAVVVPTRAAADQLADRLPDLSGDRVHVIGEGVADVLLTSPTAERAQEARHRLGLPDRFLLSVATVEPRKGLDVLLTALAQLGAEAPPLLVVGQSGWGGLDVTSMARSAGLAADSVRALGRVDDGDLAVLLRAATMLVAPSRAEGFGLPVVEAMAVGTPVVCSDDPALVEVAGPAAAVGARGTAGELAVAIAGLLGDDGERGRMSARGLARAADFTWHAVAQRTWQLYRDLLGGNVSLG